MAPDEPLSSADYQSVLRAGGELHARGWRDAFTVNEVIEAWRHVVESVETGYQLTIDDYTNDVSIRKWAEEAGPLLTPRVRASMNERLALLDDRFLASTFETPGRLPGGGQEWWCRRLPRVLVGELAEDVARMGLEARP